MPKPDPAHPHFWMDQVDRAVEESGMKALLAWCHFGIGTEHELGGKTFEDTVDFGALARRRQRAHSHNDEAALALYGPARGPARFAEEAHRVGVGMHFHLSETQEQLDSRKEAASAYS